LRAFTISSLHEGFSDRLAVDAVDDEEGHLLLLALLDCSACEQFSDSLQISKRFAREN
jgi:hypothetical protein